MLTPSIIRQMTLSTCAVFRMAIKHEDAIPAAIQKGEKLVLPDMQVHATAFLVDDNVLITNRHVVALIAEDHQKTGNHKHWYVQFTFPQVDGHGWSQSIKRISTVFALVDPSGGGALDVGLLTIRGDLEELGPCRPVQFGELDDVAVGADIGICGFPLGNHLLKNASLGVFRDGPIVHRGMISAISPYDTVNSRSIESFLTDMNTAGGMSGSPVFLPNTGKVIGLHYAGHTGTIGIALPIDQSRVNGWIKILNRFLEDPTSMEGVMLSPGGDLAEPPK